MYLSTFNLWFLYFAWANDRRLSCAGMPARKKRLMPRLPGLSVPRETSAATRRLNCESAISSARAISAILDLSDAGSLFLMPRSMVWWTSTTIMDRVGAANSGEGGRISASTGDRSWGTVASRCDSAEEGSAKSRPAAADAKQRGGAHATRAAVRVPSKAGPCVVDARWPMRPARFLSMPTALCPLQKKATCTSPDDNNHCYYPLCCCAGRPNATYLEQVPNIGLLLLRQPTRVSCQADCYSPASAGQHGVRKATTTTRASSHSQGLSDRVLINISDIMKVVCCVLALASAVGAKTLTPRSEMAPLLALRGGSCNTRSKMEPLAARLFSAESPLLLCVC